MECALADPKVRLSEELRQVRDQINVLLRNPAFTASSQPSARASIVRRSRPHTTIEPTESTTHPLLVEHDTLDFYRHTILHHRHFQSGRKREGQSSPELEQRARTAAKEYHDAIRRQKSSHMWECDSWTLQSAKVVKSRRPKFCQRLRAPRQYDLCAEDNPQRVDRS
jgi:hypothetical protein